MSVKQRQLALSAGNRDADPAGALQRVMWDNHQVMHRGRPFPAHEVRDVRRQQYAS
jgi:hypothetical protein